MCGHERSYIIIRIGHQFSIIPFYKAILGYDMISLCSLCVFSMGAFVQFQIDSSITVFFVHRLDRKKNNQSFSIHTMDQQLLVLQLTNIILCSRQPASAFDLRLKRKHQNRTEVLLCAQDRKESSC